MGTIHSNSVIEIEHLTHVYDKQPVLRDIHLSVHQGEIFGFLGHNGAGKTTAMNILTTLLTPTKGTVRVCGFDAVANANDVRRVIGYLPENVRFYDSLTAAENLQFFADLSGVKNQGAVMETLRFLDCTNLAHRRLGAFSKGMRQRIGIAQAILHKPKVLFLDEPTSGLDPEGVLQLRETILKLNNELGMTIFMNTHLLSEVSKVCTSIGVLNHGTLIYTDSLENTLLRFPGDLSLEAIYLKLERA